MLRCKKNQPPDIDIYNKAIVFTLVNVTCSCTASIIFIGLQKEGVAAIDSGCIFEDFSMNLALSYTFFICRHSYLSINRYRICLSSTQYMVLELS